MSFFNWKKIGKCKHCHSSVYWNENENKLHFTGHDCLCELDENKEKERNEQKRA